jgi:hypothetical protein
LCLLTAGRTLRAGSNPSTGPLPGSSVRTGRSRVTRGPI